MNQERQVRLFRNGRNQALRIPREFELESDEALLRKEGDRLYIEPVYKKGRLLGVLSQLESIEDDFPEIKDLPPAEEEDIF